MPRESSVRQAAALRSHRHDPFERYAWLFMRLSGAVLLVMALYHLMYMHFIVPGGVTALDYAVIAARWTDPTWGVYWRTFDLLLLILGVTHSANGLRKVLDDHVYHSGGRRAAKLTLYLVVIFLAAAGTIIIFSFRSTS